MPLNPPQVGALSVCSTSVLMQHQLAGAGITLLVDDGSAIPLGPARSVWQVMDFPPGLTLRKDSRVAATQSLNGERSAPGIPVVVQGTGDRPSNPQPYPDSHIYSCAGNVSLAGMTPGTKADVLSGGVVLGSSMASDGNCLVVLSSAVPGTTALTARASTCGLPPVTVTLPIGDTPPLTTSERLPAVSVGSPLMDCVEWLRLDGIVPGAQVSLRRGDGSVQAWQLGVRSWTVPLAMPLRTGEPVTLLQEFPLCHITGDELHLRVAGLSVPAPRIVTPWCAGRVLVANLVPGATVVFLDQSGTEIGRSGTPGTSAQFTLIQPHTSFRVQQEVCGVRSASSNLADSGSDTLTDPSPEIVGMLFACQTLVKVTGQVEGGITEIWSDRRAMIGWQQATGPEALVRVTALQPGEVIQANMVTCAGQSATSAPPVPVSGVAEISVPAVRPPVAGDTSVTVTNVNIGARLDLYVDGAFVSAVNPVTADPIAVPATMSLREHQRVHARQGLCSQWQSGPDVGVAAAPVTPPPPPAQQFTASKMIIRNCNTNHRPVHIWRLLENGSPTEIGTLAPDYNDTGTCPAGVEALEVTFPAGHRYLVVAVDPDNHGCNGQNDPLTLACRRSSYPAVITGSDSGPVLTWQVD